MHRPVPSQSVPSGFRPTHLAVHYSEVALKGKNRPWFERHLAENMKKALAYSGWTGASVERLFGRLLVDPGKRASGPAPVSEAAEVLRRVFGIAYIMPVARLEPTLEAMSEAACRAVEGATSLKTFAVKCRRATKEFPFDSMEAQRVVGAAVKRRTGWKVDLENPDCLLRIECVNGVVFLGIGHIPGPGGLPTGVSGRVACLLSGGIDSPVAAYRVLRRGATAIYVHFESSPYTGLESQEKAAELVGIVQPPGFSAKLYLVPFAELQRKIAARCTSRFRVLLYRRFMIRVAERIARREGALALVTGESLGQVSSQTLENLRAIDAVADLPVLRPLIGMDKIEIMEEATRIGTYDVSIQPHGDCCSFLQPPDPATRATPEELEREEGELEVQSEVERIAEAARCVQIAPSARRLWDSGEQPAAPQGPADDAGGASGPRVEDPSGHGHPDESSG